MPELFGLDIAGIVAGALESAGGLRPGVLRPGSGDHAFQGFTETKSLRTGDGRVEDAAVYRGTPLLSIVGASLPAGVTPTVNDRATMDGVTYELLELVTLDPAHALYTFRVAA